MIIPALDIINGNTVRLYQGKYHSQSYYGNPHLILLEYIQQGATMIHLVDLDGAQNPNNRQLALIIKLIHTAITAKLKVQVGGGIRHSTDIKMLLKLGANRVILGSIAITQPAMVKQWFTYFGPDVLVLALDICIDSKNNRKIVIHGWQKETDIQLEEIIENYNPVGLKHVLCTDTLKDGTLLGSNIDLYQSICYKWPNILFQASGGVSKITEIFKLRSAGVDSIIIGRSFLEKKITLKEAISCWQNE